MEGAKSANYFMLFLLLFNVIVLPITFGSQIVALIPMPWTLAAGQFLGLLLPLLIFILISPGKKKLTFERKPLGITNILLIIALSFLFQPIMMFISALASLAFPNPVTGLISALTEIPFFLGLAIVAVTPAICEEVVFRGYIQSKYKGQPMFITALVNGLFFGIIHMNLHQFTYAFILGIVFAYMVYFTKSILSAVISHFIINASQFSLGYMAASLIDEPTIQTAVQETELAAAIAMLGQFSLFILPLLVVILYIFVRHNNRRNNLPEEPAEEISSPISSPFDRIFFAVIFVYILLVGGFI